jgi:DNA polymerase
VRRVAIEPDFESWRRAARALLVEGVPPEAVWFDDGSQSVLPGLIDEPVEPTAAGALAVPKSFVTDAKVAADHRDPERWQFLYGLLVRCATDRRVMDNLTDPDVVRLARMVKSIRRDVHKMHAFVRFRKVEPDSGSGRPSYVAFHRPDHYIVRRVAPFFRERFGGMRWAILTPDASVSWDGHRLCFADGVPASAVPEEDALDDVWRTYYASIFNPARPKVRAMKAELPVRHWATLPEARIIPDLLRQARSRSDAMIAKTAANPRPEGAAGFIPESASIESLSKAVQGCRGCELCDNGSTQAVFGEGPSDARCVFVGEQPGDTEDRVGRPFVGPAGQLMDELLDEAGLDRRQVYVTNTVKHFHFVNKGKFRLHQKPMARHVTACKPWLEAELNVLRPPMLVALGSTAAQALMGRDFRVTKSRGEVMKSPHADWFMATIHPSAILRIPDDADRERARADFVADMRKVAAAMRQAA